MVGSDGPGYINRQGQNVRLLKLNSKLGLGKIYDTDYILKYNTECVNSLVSRFGLKLLSKFPRPVGHTTAAVQPGKQKIARGTSTKSFYQTVRSSY